MGSSKDLAKHIKVVVGTDNNLNKEEICVYVYSMFGFLDLSLSAVFACLFCFYFSWALGLRGSVYALV